MELKPEQAKRLARAVSAAGAVLLPVLWLWETRGRWSIAIPAFVVVSLVGFIGSGLYWLVRERRLRRPDVLGWFLSGAVTIAVSTAGAAWYSGDWLGLRTAVGAVSAGTAFACWLVFLRILIRGVPTKGEPSD